MDAIEELLTRRVDKIYPSKQALEKVLRSGKKLRLYQGFDPSTPNLHIGHLVGLLKLKEFQELGHEVIFLIGDFTGMIGDPTGKDKSRKILTREEVLENAKTYKNQLEKVLKIDGPNPVRILFNSEWNSKLRFADVLKLCNQFTVQQLLERDMFQKRLKEGRDISLAEFLYPIMQAYDCVSMDVDLEVGGSDQTFNMLIGRHLMHKLKGKEKFVLTTKLLELGKIKMGKTEGNAININNPPNQLFGQIMSLPDEVILKSFEYITDTPLKEIANYQKAIENGENPMIYKKKLAFTLVKMLNNENQAKEAEKFFESTFQKKQTPQNIPLITITKEEVGDLIDLLIKTNLVASRSEAKRLIAGNAVEINGKIYNSINKLPNDLDKGVTIRIGKHRFIKICTKSR